MKIYSNEKLIKRNNRIGNIMSIGSIVILGIGMYFSFKDEDGSKMPFTFSALIVGFMLFQVGNYFMSKWGKSPRPDEILAQALKGLDDKYALYFFQTSVSYFLIGPGGIFSLLPYNQAGSITFDEKKGRWKQKGGNFFLKTFGGESLGRPDLDARNSIIDLQNYFSKLKIEIEPTALQPVLVFTNQNALLDSSNSEINAITLDKLKDFVRKQAKSNPVSPELLKLIQEKIEVK